MSIISQIKKIDLGIKTYYDVYIKPLSSGTYTITYSIVDRNILARSMQNFYKEYPGLKQEGRLFPKYTSLDKLEVFVENVYNFFTKESEESKKLRVGSEITLLGHTGVIAKSQEFDGEYYYLGFGIHHSNLITQIYTPEILELANSANCIKDRRFSSPHFETIDNLIKFVNTVNDQKPIQKLQEPHVYHIGDKVCIKERQGKDTDYPFMFLDGMAKLKGTVYTISDMRRDCISKTSLCAERKYYNGDNCEYFLDNSEYVWHSSMFEPVTESEDIYLGKSINICGFTGEISKIYSMPTHDFTSFYVSFPDHVNCCKALREKLPNLDIIASDYGAITSGSSYFPEFRTIKELVSFIEALKAIEIREQCHKQLDKPIQKINEYEPNRLQKPKASLVRGSVPEGHSCSGRKNKTAIVSGHLSYRVCNS